MYRKGRGKEKLVEEEVNEGREEEAVNKGTGKGMRKGKGKE